MMVKRNRVQKRINHLKRKEQVVFAGFSVAEIDRIAEECWSGDMIWRGTRNCFHNISMPVKGKNSEEDLISKFPEKVLSTISSFLTLREAVSISILSRRWRYVWTTSTKLDFDHRNMMGEISPILEMDELRDLHQKRCIFVRWVNHVLGFHCGPKIESFRMAYFLGEENDSDIDQWIQFAVDKGVQKLDISLSSNSIFKNREPYKFPNRLFTKDKKPTLKHLSLDSCSMDIPPSFVSFSSLTSLSLRKVDVSQALVQNIFSNCLCLEWFSITTCSCPVRLKFGGNGSSLRLKHLNVSACILLKEIEVNDALDIASFEYRGANLDGLLFKNSAQPKRLCLYMDLDPLAGMSYALGQLASDFPQLETLMLMTPHFKEDTIRYQLPTFAKLKHLVLVFVGPHREGVVRLTSTFLKASPSLRKLELHLPTYCGKGEVFGDKAPRENCFRHESLKEVEMFNFIGGRMQVELAAHLIDTGIALEKIKIDRDMQFYEGDGKWLNVRSALRIRKRAYEVLQRKVSNSIELTVV